MENFRHKQIAKTIADIDQTPDTKESFVEWAKADKHLKLLEENALQDETILYASGNHTFVHSIAVTRAALVNPDLDDLHRWSCNPYNSRSRYVSGLASDSRTRVEHTVDSGGSKILDTGTQLVFARTFNGWQGDDRDYIEILQEFAQLSDIHWRAELSAYCRIDKHGDVEPVVTITKRGSGKDRITLVTCKRETLDEFLAATDLALVWLFDFTLLDHDSFNGWSSGAEEVLGDGIQLSYRQKFSGDRASYTRGFQILEPLGGYEEAAQRIPDRWLGNEVKEYLEFIAYDWRNEVVINISTDPAATTNYFEAKGNSRPFELSAAFFKPDVLLRYKADKDKYRVTSRDVTCRDAWHLKTYDVNEAGQVHTYICYLRDLPIEEQLHWRSFNQKPKAPISKRAYTTDFLGQWTDEIDALDRLRHTLDPWVKARNDWWTLIDEDGLDRISTPLTATRDEWADAIMDLSKAVVEGFQTKSIRSRLQAMEIEFENTEKSIKLMERLWEKFDPVCAGKFNGLRTVQHIRSKTKGHAGSREATQIAKEALREHGSFRKHFDTLCLEIIEELKVIETLFEGA